MSIYSPNRDARRVFLMSGVSAEYYYGYYLRKFSNLEIRRSLKTGSTVHGENDVYIWGEDISDNELFLRQLIGSVDKKPMDCPL